MKVKEVMNNAAAIEQDAYVKQAVKIMSDKNIGSLIIVKNKDIVGIITERDILKNISSLNSRVSSVMSKKVITISANSELDEAARLMSKNKIRRLPVIDPASGKLSGIITSTDLIAHSEDIEDEFLFD